MSIINIAVEGVDGSGKGKVISFLEQKLKPIKNIEIKNLKFPGGDINSVDYEDIRNLCKVEKYYFDSISSHINLMNMVSTVSSEYLKPLQTDHKVMISDRYYASCLAYDNLRPNGLGEAKLISYMEQYENFKPDYTILCMPDTNKCVSNNSVKTDDCETEKKVSSDEETLKFLNNHFLSYMGKHFNEYSIVDTFSDIFEAQMDQTLSDIVGKFLIT